MKKSFVTAGLLTLVLVVTSFTSTEATASTVKLDNPIEILKIDNMKLELGGNGSVNDDKKADTPPKKEPTLLDKISDWWDSL